MFIIIRAQSDSARVLLIVFPSADNHAEFKVQFGSRAKRPICASIKGTNTSSWGEHKSLEIGTPTRSTTRSRSRVRTFVNADRCQVACAHRCSIGGAATYHVDVRVRFGHTRTYVTHARRLMDHACRRSIGCNARRS